MKNKIIIGAIIIMVIGILPLIYAETIWSDEVSSVFDQGGSPQCILESGISYWKTIDSQNSAMDNCYQGNGIDANGNLQTTCCPSGYLCNGSILNSKCIQKDLIEVLSCNNYTIKRDCQMNGGGTNLPERIKQYIEVVADTGNIKSTIKEIDSSFSKREVIDFCHKPFHIEKNGKCLTIMNCGCVWDDTKNKCNDNYVTNRECVSPPPEWENCTISSQNKQDNCDEENGRITISWTAIRKHSNGTILPDNNDCKDGSKDFPCPAKIIDNTGSELPFFGLFNLMLSVLFIGLVYFFLRKR